jgi:hypothetical protein
MMRRTKPLITAVRRRLIELFRSHAHVYFRLESLRRLILDGSCETKVHLLRVGHAFHPKVYEFPDGNLRE